jgi:hypothetical protein
LTVKGEATMSDDKNIKKNKEEHRNYFRVNDVISRSVLIRKAEKNLPAQFPAPRHLR